MTGASMPPGCDTVIPQELIQIDGDFVSFATNSVKAGDNRRLKGEDLKEGKPAILAGKIIRPADLGLIASLGIAQITVNKKLRVGFFSTGTELRSIGEKLDPGCVYDSNRYTIFGMLSRLNVDLIDFGVVPDQPEDLRLTFATAAAECDVIITSGGVSVGVADYTKQIMQEMGDIGFWKLAIRPGRPMAFGSISSEDHQAVLFGLPGNPVATMVTFYQLVKPALLTMAGASLTDVPITKARSLNAIRKPLGRTEFQRGQLSVSSDGMPTVLAMPSQGSGVLSSMSEADCLIVLGHNQDSIEPGELVDIVLFEGLI
jgi:molybdopterin molybdotransferase